MLYPKFLKEQDTIGVSAPSNGITEIEDINRLNNAIKKLNDLGFKVIETNNVRTSCKGVSSSSYVRAKELEELFLNDKVKTIICASGGDFLLEMLSKLDLNIIKNNPKWIQGYSDPTGLLFTITTNLDIATIYANNFKAFGMGNWHKSLTNNIEILKGNVLVQNSFDKYEKERIECSNGLESYNLTEDVYWEILNNKNVKINGRIIGGCLDILNDLFGTKYDKTKEFIEKYKNDGIIWYFDNCEFSSEQIIRTLWKFKDNGWFNYCKGIIFGRNILETSYYDISFKEALTHSLKDLNIPIIINADLGHVSPQMTIINGAIASLEVNNGKGKFNLSLN